MPTVITKDQYLEVNSIPLATPAWWLQDVSRLHGLATRGSDRLMPGAVGVRAHRRRTTMRAMSVPLMVVGAKDHEGVTQSDIYEGLDDNIDYLMTNVITPPAGATVAAVWHRANGNMTGSVHIESFEPQAFGKGWIRFALDLSLPSGVWTPSP